MNKTDFILFSKRMRGMFPNAKVLQTKDAVDAWNEALSGISYDVAMEALRKHAETSQWPPTIADIVNGGRQVTKSKIRAYDFEIGDLSELDMELIETQKKKWGTGKELRMAIEAAGLNWGE